MALFDPLSVSFTLFFMLDVKTVNTEHANLLMIANMANHVAHAELQAAPDSR